MHNLNGTSPIEESMNDFKVPVLVKEVDNRGYVYIMMNIHHSNIFKVGKTKDLVKRLAEYNKDQPEISTRCIKVSNMFEDAGYVESQILYWMKNETVPLQYKLEWFDTKYLDIVIRFIEEAEEKLL